MPSRGRSRNRAGSGRGGSPPTSRRRQRADQTPPSSRTTDRFQTYRRSARIAQHQEDLLQEREHEIISGVTANMTDIARRTYPRNDAGPRVVDSRINSRTPDSPQRRRRESTAPSFMLETLGSRLPSRLQTNSRINLRMRVSTRVPSQMRHVNHQGLVAALILVDERTGAPLPEGYLVSASTSSRPRLVQPIGPTFEIAFEDLVVKQAGVFQLKVTLLRMPEASAGGGQATHVAEWESDAIRVQTLANGS